MIGIDEVGRGCLAGPLLVVAARQPGDLPSGLADSKLLTRLQRESIFEHLISNFDFGEGWVKAIEIDRLGIAGAMRLGVARALRQLGVDSSQQIIMDGPINYFPRKYKKVRCVIGADAEFPIVSAASIYAKVRRDRYMVELAKKHADYGFENHVGYLTFQHRAAIKNFGPLGGIHRLSFRPLKGAI